MTTVLITGIAGALGSSMAPLFIKKGFKVIGIDRDVKAMSKLSKEILTYECDVSSRQEMFKTFDDINSTHGVPDILVNNVGVSYIGKFSEQTLENFDSSIRVNFMSIVDAFHFWLPKFEARGSGNITTISSVAGHVPSGLITPYCSSKFALVGFVESLRVELEAAKSKINLTLISPGFINSPMVKLGQEAGFPDKLKYILAETQKTAHEIVDSILRNDTTYIPTLNGKVLKLTASLAPGLLKLLSKKAIKLIDK